MDNITYLNLIREKKFSIIVNDIETLDQKQVTNLLIELIYYKERERSINIDRKNLDKIEESISDLMKESRI
jgi:hypothetical protein